MNKVRSACRTISSIREFEKEYLPNYYKQKKELKIQRNAKAYGAKLATEFMKDLSIELKK